MSVYDSAVLADGPVGYWKLDELSGTIAADASGNGHDGTYTKVTAGANLPTLAVASLLNSDSATAVGFDGTGGCVQLPNPSLTGTFSIEAWFKFTGDGSLGATGFATLWEINNEWLLWNAGGGQLLAQGSGGNYFSSSSIAIGSVHHIVYTVNGTTEIIYIDGVPQASNPNASAVIAAAWRIGARSDLNYAFNGAGQKLALYNYVLSPAKVAAHYTAGTTSGTTYSDSPSGSLTSTGTSIDQRTGANTPTGNLTLAGSTIRHTIYSDVSVGQLILAGSLVGAVFAMPTTDLTGRFETLEVQSSHRIAMRVSSERRQARSE